MRSVSFFPKVILALFLFAPVSAHANSVFQSATASGRNFALFPFWQQVISDMAIAQPEAVVAHPDAAHPQRCANERLCIPIAWTSFLESVRKMSRRDQLNAVNAWANSRPYVEDIQNYHVSDYWATPGQFLARGGDCEDYAIAKYYSLVRLGFPTDDLRLVIVDDTNLNVFHAVLAVRLDNNVWLLDNQLQHVVPMDIAVQYVPIYSLNEHGWWVHSMPKITLGNVVISAGRDDNHPGGAN
ncbi:MAG: transglutaminase-like cysteine peptidase [Proteobacteria bacterium]|nr:transglutaminase-like cysteine peptidase [Pseudomonadota bacterium]